MPRKIIVPTGDPTSPMSMDAGTLRRLGIDPKDIERMSEKEKILLFQSLQELADSGSSVTLQSLEAEDFKYPPVSMEQFLTDPYYAGDIAKSMYPAVKAMLIEVFDQGGTKPVELVLAGAIGWGKSTAAAMALVYVSYRLSCLHDPHDYYGLMRGADIVIGIYSVTIDQALDGAYGKMLHWFDQIPYFLQKCPRVKRINSEIKFSNLPLLIISGSNELHTIGKDMICFLLDEANYLDNSSNTSIASGIYNNALKRVKSRFLNSDGTPDGLSILASSKKTKSSFVEDHLKNSRQEISEGRTRVYAFAQWEVLPAYKFQGTPFQVEIGDRLNPSRVLDKGETPRAGAEVINVPEQFRREFERDCEKSLRDLAGIASESTLTLFRDKSVITKAVSTDVRHPFTKETLTISVNDNVPIEEYFKPEVLFKINKSRYTLRRHPGSSRYLHVDIGLTKDALSIGMCHIAEMSRVERTLRDGTSYIDSAPIMEIDFIVRMKAQRGGEVDLAKVRAFILYLRSLGVPIRYVSYDGYQSADSRQILRSQGIPAHIVSLDRTDEPYLALRQVYQEGRLRIYQSPVLERELSELERDVDKGKVDHPKVSPGTGQPGSKDMSDSLCGCVWAATNDKAMHVLLNTNPDAVSALPVHSRVDTGSISENLERRVAVPGGAILWNHLDKDR